MKCEAFTNSIKKNIMNVSKKIYVFLWLAVIMGGMSCSKTLDLQPTNSFSTNAVWSSPALVQVFVNEIYGTHRKDVIRLIVTEGPRFPKLAEFYYREVIARVLPVIRGRLMLAVERGELAHDALARFPQLLVAPALLAILWSSLFERFAPLDVRELMRAHVELLLGTRDPP